MNIPCDMIRDLLPLYHDKVCSEESRKQVEEHLQGCEACRAALGKIEDSIQEEHSMNEAEPMRKIAKTWKRSKMSAFLKGALLVSILACVSCFAAFSMIGSTVDANGILHEPFGLIPIGYLFALLAVIFGVCLLVGAVKKKK